MVTVRDVMLLGHALGPASRVLGAEPSWVGPSILDRNLKAPSPQWATGRLAAPTAPRDVGGIAGAQQHLDLPTRCDGAAGQRHLAAGDNVMTGEAAYLALPTWRPPVAGVLAPVPAAALAACDGCCCCPGAALLPLSRESGGSALPSSPAAHPRGPHASHRSATVEGRRPPALAAIMLLHELDLGIRVETAADPNLFE